MTIGSRAREQAASAPPEPITWESAGAAARPPAADPPGADAANSVPAESPPGTPALAAAGSIQVAAGEGNTNAQARGGPPGPALSSEVTESPPPQAVAARMTGEPAAGAATQPGRHARPGGRRVDAEDFAEAFGEPLARALDLATWLPGDDYGAVMGELRREIGRSVGQEGRLHARIRELVFPRLAARRGAVAGAGVYRVETPDLALAHRGLLLNGGVEACDGTVAIRDAIPLTIIRIGVCLVSYDGKQNRYSQQLFRRDLRLDEGDPVAQTIAALDGRRGGSDADPAERHDALSDLSRRGIMAFAERAVLAQESRGIWRVGHGSPMPVELLSGSGSMELLAAGTREVREPVERHRRFLFVPSAARERDWLTVGQALRPLEFAIVDTLQGRLQRIVDAAHYYRPADRALAQCFADEVGPQIAIGLYRVSEAAPALLFYAHVEHAAEAALLAMADSAMQAHRGFPLLIDLAERWCQDHFGHETLRTIAQEAYADAGAPFRYAVGGRGKG